MEKIFNFFQKNMWVFSIIFIFAGCCLAIAFPGPEKPWTIIIPETLRIIIGIIGGIIVLFLIFLIIVIITTQNRKRQKTPPEIESNNRKAEYNIVNIFSEETVEKALQEGKNKNN